MKHHLAQQVDRKSASAERTHGQPLCMPTTRAITTIAPPQLDEMAKDVTGTPTPSLTPEAKVLNTFELLEMILARAYKLERREHSTHYAMKMLLLRQGVTLRWRDVVQCSRRLQQFLWLRHESKVVEEGHFNPLLDTHHRAMVAASSRDAFAWSCFSSPETREFNRYVLIDATKTSNLEHLLPKDQSWKDMRLWRGLACPVPRRIEVRILHKLHRVGRKVCWQEHIIMTPAEMTAGELVEEIVRVCKNKSNIYVLTPFGRRELLAMKARRAEKRLYAWKQRWSNRLDKSWRDIACEVVARVCIRDYS